jgi:uncharacterized membrane protein YcaP (DUF421 family)
MDSVIRGLIVYLFLLVVFRIAGKRTLAETSNFELVVLLIISETTQQAMIDSDHSMTNAALVIITLLGATIALSIVKERYPAVDRVVGGTAVVLIENGHLQWDRLRATRVGPDDIMTAARDKHGLERMQQVKYAILEAGGGISIIPREKEGATSGEDVSEARSGA